MFRSVRLYLQDYKNTSLTKDVRLIAVMKAGVILEHVIINLNDEVQAELLNILISGFNKILLLIKQAEMDPNVLIDMNDSIGFLKILEDAK